MADDRSGLKPGDVDAQGNIVLRVWSNEQDQYIIYETTTRSIVCDAIKSSVASQPTINNWVIKIAGLTSQHSFLKPTYNGSIAHALKIFFDGDQNGCESALEGI